MTNFLGFLLVLSAISTSLSFMTPPTNKNKFNLFMKDEYSLAKEYYEYKTKQLSVSNTFFFENINQPNELANVDYVEFAKNYENNYRIFSKNWFIVKEHNNNNKNLNLELNKFADNIDFNSTSLPNDLINFPKDKIIKKNTWYKNFFFSTKTKIKNVFSNDPKKIDWREHGILTPIKDQKSCGSCWAFSSTSALEAFLKKNKVKVERLSEQELVDCSSENNGCNGGLMDLAFDYIIENNGLHTDRNYPYNAKNNKCMKNCKVKDESLSCTCHHDEDNCQIHSESESEITYSSNRNCTSDDKLQGSGDFYYRFTTPYSIDSLKESVKSTPVSIAINANTPLFRFYSNGIVEDPEDGRPDEINHAVLLVGFDYDDKGLYWIIQNSWGKDWGDNGFIKVRGKDGSGVLSCQLYGVYPNTKN